MRVVSLQPYVWAPDQRRPRTILLVEDDPFVLDATSRILQSADFNVLPAVDAQAAIKIFADHLSEIDLVMTDMVLPGHSGQQLTQDLRDQSPTLAVLVTSGYANPEYETEAPDSRSYFLPKPYSKRTLVDKIEKILAPSSQVKAATQAG